MEEKLCQCCGMPLGEREELLGSNRDGSKNEKYCRYCFKQGEVSFKGTMEDMIKISIPFMTSEEVGMSEAQARANLEALLPQLTYWKSMTK